MNNTSDDLEAVRTIVSTLQGFEEKDQERIIRWAREKLGLITNLAAPITAHQVSPSTITPAEIQSENRSTDIGTFVRSKNPVSDVQFAATIAYYYRFEAPANERKDTVASADLQEACRKVNRKRLNDPADTLNNAYKLGLLDKGAERGYYSINSVGENLVAMTLPQQTQASVSTRSRKPKTKVVIKNSK